MVTSPSLVPRNPLDWEEEQVSCRRLRWGTDGQILNCTRRHHDSPSELSLPLVLEELMTSVGLQLIGAGLGAGFAPAACLTAFPQWRRRSANARAARAPLDRAASRALLSDRAGVPWQLKSHRIVVRSSLRQSVRTKNRLLTGGGRHS